MNTENVSYDITRRERNRCVYRIQKNNRDYSNIIKRYVGSKVTLKFTISLLASVQESLQDATT